MANKKKSFYIDVVRGKKASFEIVAESKEEALKEINRELKMFGLINASKVEDGFVEKVEFIEE